MKKETCWPKGQVHMVESKQFANGMCDDTSAEVLHLLPVDASISL